MVANLLSFCASPCIAPSGTRAASRTRWQADGTTRPPAYSSDGSVGSPVPSPAAGAMRTNLSVNGREKTPSEIAVGGLVKVKVGTGAWTYRMKYPIVQSNEEKISPKCVLRGLIELSTMSNGSTQKGWSFIVSWRTRNHFVQLQRSLVSLLKPSVASSFILLSRRDSTKPNSPQAGLRPSAEQQALFLVPMEGSD
jgi:hypothetical protein